MPQAENSGSVSLSLAEHQAQAAAFLGDDLSHPRIGATLSLVEELGELVKEIMELEIYGKQAARAELEGEVADVLFSLFEVCTAYGISLEEAYTRKVQVYHSKADKWRAESSEVLRRMKAKLD